MKNQQLTKLLLDWFAQNGRDLPWRYKGGAHPNPYIVFVSEMMLQQTTVKTVIPYFTRFIQRFPTVQDLASATDDEVAKYWQGLGYYSRARALLHTAQTICQIYDGHFPQIESEVAKLKGFGPYMTASFLALAFNQPQTVIDGNVMRIMCRMFGLTQPLDEIQPKIRQYAATLASKTHPADYASAIMDLGATVCTPKKPLCVLCPWQKYCASNGRADIEQIPARRSVSKKEYIGFVFIVYNARGQVYIRKRSEKGLLHGLYEFPWNTATPDWLSDVSASENYVTHVFTHIKMKLQIVYASAAKAPDDGFFVFSTQLTDYPMSTLMQKVRRCIKTTKARSTE